MRLRTANKLILAQLSDRSAAAMCVNNNNFILFAHSIMRMITATQTATSSAAMTSTATTNLA